MQERRVTIDDSFKDEIIKRKREDCYLVEWIDRKLFSRRYHADSARNKDAALTLSICDYQLSKSQTLCAFFSIFFFSIFKSFEQFWAIWTKVGGNEVSITTPVFSSIKLHPTVKVYSLLLFSKYPCSKVFFLFLIIPKQTSKSYISCPK